MRLVHMRVRPRRQPGGRTLTDTIQRTAPPLDHQVYPYASQATKTIDPNFYPSTLLHAYGTLHRLTHARTSAEPQLSNYLAAFVALAAALLLTNISPAQSNGADIHLQVHCRTTCSCK
jgi:hypothetical protein